MCEDNHIDEHLANPIKQFVTDNGEIFAQVNFLEVSIKTEHILYVQLYGMLIMKQEVYTINIDL